MPRTNNPWRDGININVASLTPREILSQYENLVFERGSFHSLNTLSNGWGDRNTIKRMEINTIRNLLVNGEITTYPYILYRDENNGYIYITGLNMDGYNLIGIYNPRDRYLRINEVRIRHMKARLKKICEELNIAHDYVIISRGSAGELVHGLTHLEGFSFSDGLAVESNILAGTKLKTDTAHHRYMAEPEIDF